ncbi:MAG: lamin tail domain-containing protein [bacterium]|nr:lamin tail domain-containing protein [bacterium]
MLRTTALLMVSVLLFPFFTHASHGSHVLIGELQVGGASANDEFIELYNPTGVPVDLAEWRLAKRTASGSESNLLTAFPAMTIAPHASVLIAHPSGAFAGGADAVYSTSASLSLDNTCVLYAAPVGGVRTVVDLIGWGSATSVEGAAAANPAAGASLERKPGGSAGNGTDTENNAADVAAQGTPTPQSASVAARPIIEEETPPPAPPQDEGEGYTIVVGEVQIGGDAAVDEYVEISNIGDGAVNLEGWRLAKRTAGGSESNLLTAFPAITIAAGAGVTIAHPSGSFASTADAVYSTAESLAADNTVVLYAPLADGVRPVADLVGWGGASSFEGSATQQPTAGSVLERKPGGDAGHGQDTDDNGADFVVHEQTPPPAPPQDEGEGQGAPLTEPSIVAPPPVPKHVRINEFVSDPADGDVEWVELYNTGTSAVNLVDWTIEDGSERTTFLSGVLPVGGFVVVEEPAGKLNNGGDRIALHQPDGTLVDAVSYGDWDDGNRSDNAPAVSDPAAVARVVDGGDTDSDARDWVRTEVPTRGAPNVVASVPNPSADPAAQSQAAPRRTPIVVLNELYPNPLGSDAEDEFIEIANIGDWGTMLDGWRVRDDLGTEYVINAKDGPTSLGAGGVLALSRSRTGIALNNTGGDAVRLFKPDGDRAASLVEWKGVAEEGLSYARSDRGVWVWSTIVTAGVVNTIETPNELPEAVIDAPDTVAPQTVVAFDGTDSADPDAESLTYLWDFGDPQTQADVATNVIGRYVYAQPGAYTVTLTVTDTRGGVATTEHEVMVMQSIPSVISSESSSREISSVEQDFSATASDSLGRNDEMAIRLSELLVNPVGRDTDGEWVEIENTSDGAVSLDGWAFVTIGSSERRSPLPEDAVVPAHGYAVIPRSQLRAALTNSGATVELRAPDGTVMDSTAYADAKEGWSFARLDGAQWQWTSAPSPNAHNAFVAGVRIVADSGSGGASASTTEGVLSVRIADLDDIALGSDIIVRGTVTAAPGDVGKQVFYIADGGAGLQVYVGNRVLPTLAIGTTVEVTGEYRMAAGEPRVGIRAPEDVRVVGSDVVPEPVALRAADASDAALGALVALEGEVMERRGTIIHVDDGSDELRVALSGAAATDTDVRAGDTVRIVGILSKTQSGFRILARTSGDVTVLARAEVGAASAILPTQPLRQSIEIGVIVGAAGAFALASLWRRLRTIVRRRTPPA